MTKVNDAKLTAEQQLDVLWALMKELGVMVGVTRTGTLLVDTNKSNQVVFHGTREEIIEQLCARQVAARLQT